VESAQIPIEGILPASALSRVESNGQETSRVISQSIHSETGAPSRCAYVMLANFSNEPLVVPKVTVLGVAREISESFVKNINPKYKSNAPVKPQKQKKNETLYPKLLQGKLDHFSQDERQLIEPTR